MHVSVQTSRISATMVVLQGAHQGMAGHFVLRKDGDTHQKHASILICRNAGTKCCFCDMRPKGHPPCRLLLIPSPARAGLHPGTADVSPPPQHKPESQATVLCQDTPSCMPEQTSMKKQAYQDLLQSPSHGENHMGHRVLTTCPGTKVEYTPIALARTP